MRMKRKWFFLVAPPALVLFIAIGGEVVMHLWNWLLPELFGWRMITFWQALGLLTLTRILFGGLGCHGSDDSKSQLPSDKRWERMTPGEREKFRQDLHSRLCGSAEPTSGTGQPA